MKNHGTTIDETYNVFGKILSDNSFNFELGIFICYWENPWEKSQQTLLVCQVLFPFYLLILYFLYEYFQFGDRGR